MKSWNELRNVTRCVVILTSILCICCLLVWFVIPYLLMGWDVVFPHYDHKVAILPYNIECQVPTEGSEFQHIVLPKGLMIYAPCRHDFARMSLDEKGTYKIYLKLDAKTIKALFKDSDALFHENIHKVRRHGELMEKH